MIKQNSVTKINFFFKKKNIFFIHRIKNCNLFYNLFMKTKIDHQKTKQQQQNNDG